MINTLLRSYQWYFCLCCLDVFVYSPVVDEHLDRLEKVLTCFRSTGPQLNAEKCLLDSRSQLVLGHVVDQQGIRLGPPKFPAIRGFPVPHDQKVLFLASDFRWFI